MSRLCYKRVDDLLPSHCSLAERMLSRQKTWAKVAPTCHPMLAWLFIAKGIFITLPHFTTEGTVSSLPDAPLTTEAY